MIDMQAHCCTESTCFTSIKFLLKISWFMWLHNVDDKIGGSHDGLDGWDKFLEGWVGVDCM